MIYDLFTLAVVLIIFGAPSLAFGLGANEVAKALREVAAALRVRK